MPAAKKSSNLFDDEGLFGTEEEDPKVDIFNKPPSPVPAKAVPQPEPQVCSLYIKGGYQLYFPRTSFS